MSSEISDTVYQAQRMMDTCKETIVLFGPDALDQLAAHIMLNEYKTIMLIMGGTSSQKSGVFEQILRSPLFGKQDLNLPFYENVPPEPDTECIRNIVNTLRKEKPDAVIAIGGGSVLDAAKAATISWQTGLDIEFLFGKNTISSQFPEQKFKRIFAIPTTAGTGSEVTCYSNIIDPKTGVKKLIADPVITPELAAVNTLYTCSAPEALTRTTGLDALVHAIESYLNINAAEKFPEAAKYAEQAIRMIVPALPALLKNLNNGSARIELSAAATLAGMAISAAPTSLPHLLSFSFCGKAPHGLTVAALLPHFWRFYLNEEKVRRQTLALASYFPGETPEEIVKSYEIFVQTCGGTVFPGELAKEPVSMIDKLAEDAIQNPVKLESAPRRIAPQECKQLFHEILDPVWNKK